MIEFFFIIDFADRVQLPMPAKRQKHFGGVIDKARARVLARSQNADGLIEKIADRNRRLHLFAQTNDDNFTVCVVTGQNDNIKEEVWAVIREVIAELRDFDGDRDDLEGKRAAMQAILGPHFERDVLERLGSLTGQAKDRVRHMHQEAEEDADKLQITLVEQVEVEKEARAAERLAGNLKSQAWLEDKRTLVALFAISLVVFALLLVGLGSLLFVKWV